MIQVASFTFNPFQENTYILYDETASCVIIDPGCYMPEEKRELTEFVKTHRLTPARLLNTHCHIDHVLGNKYIFETFGLLPELHHLDLPNLRRGPEYGTIWGVFMERSPEPKTFLEEKDFVRFGNSELEILFTPGHSAGSICFFSAKDKLVIAGDVLFDGSIGRTDLPGGDFDTLIRSISEKLFPLGDEVKVYPGHGPPTTVGKEKKFNPFLKGE